MLEFADEPGAVQLSTRLTILLQRLSAATDGAVAFVSGRTIPELDRLLAPHKFALAGVHGNERRGSDARILAESGDPGILGDIRCKMDSFRSANTGVLIEDKRISLALHYRKRADLEDEIREFALALAESLPPGFELLWGSKVVEVKPVAMDKGSAVRAFMSEPPFAERTPVFIGDDVTDEAAFKVVNELGGVSVKVSSGETAANWRLANVEAVLNWLEDLVGR